MKLLDELTRHCSVEATLEEEVIDRYSTDESIFRIRPLLVVYPKSAGDVSSIVSFCHDKGIAITSRGGGSSIPGQSIGDGIIIDFKKYMGRIIGVDKSSRTVKAQPGVILKDLNDYLEKYGFFFPPDPSSITFCTLGGMVSTNAGGIHTVKYGSTKNYVKRLEIICDDGSSATAEAMELVSTVGTVFQQKIKQVEEIVTANRELIESKRPDVIKNSSGYNLFEFKDNGLIHPEKLICGSEGTLAIVTEAELKIEPVPSDRVLIAIHYITTEDACSNVKDILRLKPSALEIIDETSLKCVSRVLEKKVFPETSGAVLLCEFSGNDRNEIDEKLSIVSSALKNVVATQVEMGKGVERLWDMRRAVSKSIEHYPGKERSLRFIEDACVHPKKVLDYIVGVKEIIAREGFNCAIFGHAGDGNIHVNVFLNPDDMEHLKKAEKIYGDVTSLVVKLKGALSGEHGDGYLRAGEIRRIYGPVYDLFCEVKRIFDPTGILNPEKILSDVPFSQKLQALKYS